jgi:hypothetical protein
MVGPGTSNPARQDHSRVGEQAMPVTIGIIPIGIRIIIGTNATEIRI